MRFLSILGLCVMLCMTGGCVAELQKALINKSASASALSGPVQSMTYPVYYGSRNAANTMIFYHNPHCPYSAKVWPQVRQFAEQQSPDTFKLIVTGEGFDVTGTWLLYHGAVVAEQDQALARAYLSEISRKYKTIRGNTGTWTSAWQKKQKKSAFDIARATALIEQDYDKFYLKGKKRISQKYALRATPSFVINGKVYKGTPNAAGFGAFMAKTSPRAALP